MRTLLLLLSACVAASLAVPAKTERRRYDGYQLLEITLTREDQRQFVVDLHQDHELDFWSDSPRLDRPIQVLVPPHKVAEVVSKVEKNGLSYKVVRQDVQERLDEDWARLDAKKAFDLDDYNTLEDIYSEMHLMADRCPSHLGVECEVFSMGQSYEGREILAIKISKPAEGDRTVFWFEATTHAREWLATQTHVNIMYRFTAAYETDPVVRDFIDKYDFYFAPVINPDGYVFTWVDDRYWRKSRNVNEGSPCMGVDLNRNFDYMWGNAGTSSAPCSDNYLGAYPASEPEVQAVQNWANALGNRAVCWTSFHTQGQLWLHPYGWVEENDQCAYAPDHDDLYEVATATGEAIEQTHGTDWNWGNSCAEIYPASGITIDYVKEVSGIKYSFTPELRGPGHDPPATEIPPSREEVWNGVVAMINKIEEKHPGILP